MADTMKCPFREKDGEYCDCYGKACMAYYEVPFVGCSTDSEPMKLCRKIMSQYPSNATLYIPQLLYPYQRFTYGGTTNL